MNERIAKNFLLHQRTYAKYDAFKAKEMDENCKRLSNLKGNIVKPFKNTPLSKPNVEKYSDLCTKTQKKHQEHIHTYTEPPKSRQNHLYFMQRTLFNYATPNGKKTFIRKPYEIKPIEKSKKSSAFSSAPAPCTRCNTNRVEHKLQAAIFEESAKDIPKKSSVHTLYRKNWKRASSLESLTIRAKPHKTVHTDKYKDLAILHEAPSKQLRVIDAKSKNPAPSTVVKHLMKMKKKEQEKLKQKESEVLHAKQQQMKQKEKEAIKVTSFKKTLATFDMRPVHSPVGLDCYENVAEKLTSKAKKVCKEDKCKNTLKDLDPNEVYAETWTKAKINSIRKFLSLPEAEKLKPEKVKVKNEAIFIPELRELNPLEFYDFHANFRPIKMKASKDADKFEKKAKIDIFLKTKPEPTNKKQHTKASVPKVDMESERQEAGCESAEENSAVYKMPYVEDSKPTICKEVKPEEKITAHTKIQATYLWVNGDDLSVKDRILNKAPKTVRDLPEWTSAESDKSKKFDQEKDCALIPKQYYNNPFKPKDFSLLILCDVQSNKRAYSKRTSCLKIIKKHIVEEPWFSFAQEYILLNMQGRPLSWNKPREAALARDLAEAHVEACLFAGLPYFANSGQKIAGKWEYQIGPAFGINAADDLWVSRYLLKRLAEKKHLQVSFDPKCLPKVTMDICTRVNFSTESMRKVDGLDHIMRAVNRLGESHVELCPIYKQRRKKNFTWAIGKTNVSVRIPVTTAQIGRGYIEDRRPAGDCDPYAIAEAMIRVCLENKANESTA